MSRLFFYFNSVENLGPIKARASSLSRAAIQVLASPFRAAFLISLKKYCLAMAFGY